MKQLLPVKKKPVGTVGIRIRSRVQTHQLLDFRLQILDTVKLSLAAALRSNPVFTSSPNIMDAIELFWGQLVHFQQRLKIISREWNYSLCIKWQFYLESEINISNYCCIFWFYLNLGRGKICIYVFQGTLFRLKKTLYYQFLYILFYFFIISVLFFERV